MDRIMSVVFVRYWNWSLCVFFVVIPFVFQTGYAIINHKLISDFGLSSTEIGVIGTVYTWGVALSQLFCGSILDRLGVKRLLPIACALFSMGILIFAFSTGFYGFIIAQIFTAIGASFSFIGAGIVGALWFGQNNYGKMLAWVQFLNCLAAFLAQYFFHFAFSYLAWPEVVKGFAIVSALLAIVMGLSLRVPAQYNDYYSWPKNIKNFIKVIFQDIGRVIKTPGALITLLVGSLSLSIMLAFSILWGTHLFIHQGMSDKEAAAVISMGWLGLAFGAPVISYISDQMKSRKKPLFFSLFMQALAIVFLINMPQSAIHFNYIIMFIFGFFAGSCMLAFTMSVELVGASLAGTATGLMNSSMFVTGGILMVFPGKLLNIGATISVALWILPISILLGLMLFKGIRETARIANESP